MARYIISNIYLLLAVIRSCECRSLMISPQQPASKTTSPYKPCYRFKNMSLIRRGQGIIALTTSLGWSGGGPTMQWGLDAEWHQMHSMRPSSRENMWLIRHYGNDSQGPVTWMDRRVGGRECVRTDRRVGGTYRNLPEGSASPDGSHPGPLLCLIKMLYDSFKCILYMELSYLYFNCIDIEITVINSVPKSLNLWIADSSHLRYCNFTQTRIWT